MVQLQKKTSEFAERDVQLVAMSYDSVKTLKTFAEAKNITFPLLSDEGSKTIRALGIEYKKGIATPGTVFIGTDGVVKGKNFLTDPKVRPSVDTLLKEADEVLAVKEAAAAG